MNIFGDNSVEALNSKYFRPSTLRTLNIRNLNDFIFNLYQENPTKIYIPNELLGTPQNTIINYYSILREAASIPIMMSAGCGSIGLQAAPYPVSYNFLSKSYQNKLSYEKYIELFKNIYHINLIKLIESTSLEDIDNNKIRYYLELELISSSNCFSYSFGNIDIIPENNIFKINDIMVAQEDFFCAPYHKWEHNAESKIDIIYGDWYKLIALRYPTVEFEYTKNIYIKGVDDNYYLFVFAKLTNGTDIEIGQYKQNKLGKMIPTSIKY